MAHDIGSEQARRLRPTSEPGVVRAKLVPPRLPRGSVRRPGLLDTLRAGRGRSLTLLSAPAGFGKTTLLTEWVQHAAPRAGRLGVPGQGGLGSGALLDPRRRARWDRAGIGYGALSAVRARPEGSRRRAAASCLTSWPVGDRRGGARARRLPPRGDAPTTSALRSRVPPLPTCARPGRHRHPLGPDSRRRAPPGRGAPGRGPCGTAAFRRGEIARFLKGMGHRPSPDGGAPAGDPDGRLACAPATVRPAAAGAGRARAYRARLRREAAGHRLPDQDVLDLLEPDARDFLLRVSVLTGWTPPPARRSWRLPGSAAILAELERSNLFISVDRSGEWYRLHELFTEALRVELATDAPRRWCPCCTAGRHLARAGRRHRGWRRSMRSRRATCSWHRVWCPARASHRERPGGHRSALASDALVAGGDSRDPELAFVRANLARPRERHRRCRALARRGGTGPSDAAGRRRTPARVPGRLPGRARSRRQRRGRAPRPRRDAPSRLPRPDAGTGSRSRGSARRSTWPGEPEEASRRCAARSA